MQFFFRLCMLLSCLISISLASFSLKGQGSKKCQAITGASIADGATDVLWQCVASAAGDFESFDNLPVDPQHNINGERYYNIVAKHSGKCLTVAGGDAATGNGPQIVQWPCGAANTVLSQMYTYVKSKLYPGYFMLKARHSSKCIAVAGGSVADGAAVIQWDCADYPNFIWEVRSCELEYSSANTTGLNDYYNEMFQFKIWPDHR